MKRAATLLEELLVSLAEANVEFVVCGGVAIVLHGVERTTLDLDLSLDMSPENLARLLSVVKRLGLEPRAPVPAADILDEYKRESWIREKNAVVFTFIDRATAIRQIDILLAPVVQYTALRERAITMEIGGAAIHIASIDHLIAMKSTIQRKRDTDRSDIEALQRLRSGDY